ncbi:MULTISPECIES: DUF732 domain-containing protein [unclassified Pseudonocardia]|jgi:hypothetical protein|uniref:DUF732 domain-containing protein n=1 Tax=unclassified Pseudonocardia TaxID=2619320 RepID=UPI00095E81E4|nr:MULTISPECIES: DUF732 domain-containing protein [unclassified Pseudonocardia]MBN9101776.1 DUF732 domain-containing protein [Pseudonocardia sp.]OJY49999.1 MAG: hypothetical protein BGP03_24230 [Pseudonocardia sp. 73-21]
MVGESMNGWQSGDGTPDGVLTEERPGSTHPDGLVDEQRRRRRAAEAAADAAEAAAVDAAARASAAIAAAATAAAEAESAADLAARAAADAESAAAAERRAVERAHAISAVSANETTSVALAPVPATNGSRPSRHQVAVPGQALPPDESAVARAATMTIPAVPLREASPAGREVPATGGRAARRRAQEAAAAAAAVAREANRDPDTHVFTVDREPEAAVGETTVSPRRRRARSDDDGHPLTALLGRVRGLPGGRMVLVAAAVGGFILVAAVVAGLVGGSRGASTAAVVQEAPTSAEAAAPTSAAGGPDAAVDPTSTRAVAYLKALRAADVPTSDSGRSETEAAEVICQQLANGADAADLVRALPAVLPTVNSKQAKSVVSIAQKDYCS